MRRVTKDNRTTYESNKINIINIKNLLKSGNSKLDEISKILNGRNWGIEKKRLTQARFSAF